MGIVSVFLGPIGWIIALCSSGNMRRCDQCAEKVKPEAKVCRYCHANLALLPPPLPKRAPAFALPVLLIVVIAFVGFIIWAVKSAYPSNPAMPDSRPTTDVAPATELELAPVVVRSNGPVVPSASDKGSASMLKRIGFSKKQIADMAAEDAKKKPFQP